MFDSNSITDIQAIQKQNNLASDENKLVILEYWRALGKYKWPIIAFALIVTLLAGVIAFVSTPIYEAKTTLLIETNKQKVVSIEDVYGGVGSSREYFQTQVEVIKSREVALKTIIKLKLFDLPGYDPRASKIGLAALLEKVGFSKEEEPREWTNEALAEAVLPGFMGSLSIDPIRLSQLVIIRFNSPDPVLAAKVTNTLAQTYIENDLNARYQMTQTASAWLRDQLTELKGKLTESETALQRYREKQGLVSIKDAAQSGAGQQIEQLQSRLIEARTRRAEIESNFKTVKDASAADLASQPAVLVNVQVADAKRAATEANRRLADAAQRYGREHPKYLQADSDAKAANENLQRQIELVVGGITVEYERARNTERTLEAALNSARGTVVNINRKEFELGIYEREVESNRQMYDMFMQRAKETTVGGDLQSVVARIVDPAVAPAGPIKPKKVLIVLVALVVGLMVGAMLAMFIEILDNTFKTAEDVETKLRQPVLAVLPLLSKKHGANNASGKILLDAPHSVYAEAVRTARTGVLLSSVDIPNRTLVVTSSVPGEGKTTFACNLAMALAQTKKTLLVDADMRRPSVARAYGLDPLSLGLSELVAGGVDLQECLHVVENTNLVVMTCGAIPPNPLELIHSVRFSQTMELLSKHFEIIIIDSPPVSLVSDALVLATNSSGVIFVAKAQSTPHPLARNALKQLHRANAHLVGVVLNALDFDKAEKYYGEYSGYSKRNYGGYGSTYGAGYGAVNTAKAKASTKVPT